MLTDALKIDSTTEDARNIEKSTKKLSKNLHMNIRKNVLALVPLTVVTVAQNFVRMMVSRHQS